MKLRCNYCGHYHKVHIFTLLFFYLLRGKYYFYCKNCLLCNCIGLYLRTYHDTLDEREKETNKIIKENKL